MRSINPEMEKREAFTPTIRRSTINLNMRAHVKVGQTIVSLFLMTPQHQSGNSPWT